MKQLTDTEKQELETKIQEEQERQQHLRETNPDLPETFKTKLAKTEFTQSFLWKYGFLIIILCLFAPQRVYVNYRTKLRFQNCHIPQPHGCFDTPIQPHCLLYHDERLEKLGNENGRLGLDSTCIRLHVCKRNIQI